MIKLISCLMMQRYSKFCTQQTKQIENTAILRLFKIVDTILYNNESTFAINKLVII